MSEPIKSYLSYLIKGILKEINLFLKIFVSILKEVKDIVIKDFWEFSKIEDLLSLEINFLIFYFCKKGEKIKIFSQQKKDNSNILIN